MNLTNEEVLDLVPQQAPFRFIDKIHHIDEETIIASYTFKKDEFFFKGHFPNKPITPGVILIEACGQMSGVAHGIWSYAKISSSKDDINAYITYITSVDKAEFLKPVLPGDEVIVESKVIINRRRRFKHECSMKNNKDEIIMTCTLSGLGVEK